MEPELLSIDMPIIAKVTDVSVTTGPEANVMLYKTKFTADIGYSRGKNSSAGSHPIPAGVDYTDLWFQASNRATAEMQPLPHSPSGWTKTAKKPSCSGRGCRGCRGGCGTRLTGVGLAKFSGGNCHHRARSCGGSTSIGAYPGYVTGMGSGARWGTRGGSHGGRISPIIYEGYRGYGLAMSYAEFSFTVFGINTYAFACNGSIQGPFDVPAANSAGVSVLNFRVEREAGSLGQKGNNAMQLWGYDSGGEFMIRKCLVF